MPRYCILWLVFWVSFAPLAAQEWAQEILMQSPRHREFVQIPSGSRHVTAVVVYPEIKDKASSVLVIHEIFGLTDWVQTVADKLAANGYIAIVPDLLSGMGPNGGGSASFPAADLNRAVSSLPADQVTADLYCISDYVKKLPAANGKLAVAGFCWGGTQAFRFANNRTDLDATFVFYGTAPADVTKINAPVYGFYGGNDARVTATVPDTIELMKNAGKKFDPAIYEGAGHGFMRTAMTPGDSNASNKKALEDSWKRWLMLLQAM
jgi:carboxymethylenebutenolidase